ncbi:MAG: NADH-quinone oxidoreductase subunit F [Chloroflexi bacterium UTCFX4]|jgi:NADH-quinone oxidoreductase subunit F|nr:MAG: NADH-quinone oxidoreductase subunit F [Chloroflexi bacterium UTCFX4]
MSSIIRVGASTCGLAAGADQVITAISRQIERRQLNTQIQRTGCLGACHREPLVEVLVDGVSVLYGPITPERVPLVLDQHFGTGERGFQSDWIVSRRRDKSDYPFLARQVKVTTQLCGIINPHSLDDYLANGGYQALRQALKYTPEEIIQLIKASNLRGRGGAGFPTGMKWEITRRAQGAPKYIICNADEGDPGAFMDRTMIEGDPHRLLEGMLIGAYAMGATKGYLYVRAEYPLAVKMLREAIAAATAYGVVGKNILGSGMDFEFFIKEGAGAFVCGEETALMHSIEGYRGMPTMRPPYPSEHGLWGLPTNINNVETFASVPSIILNGPTWFASIGTAQSGGTKTFALTGAIKKSGLVEAPIGMPLRELIFEIGGGAKSGREFKAVQLGGPSGGCLPAALLDTRIDYQDLKATGAIMGSGGMVTVDDTTCMVDFARYFLAFTQDESCGKCVPCRVGTRKLLNLLTKITRGRATERDVEHMESLCETVRLGSLCGLGQTAPNPILTTLKYFKDEYMAHVLDHHCPAGVCAMDGGEPFELLASAKISTRAEELA